MKVLSLCSGVGGAELALKQSDIDAEVIGYAEIDKFASSIYERHFPNHTNLGDLTKIKAEELEDFDDTKGLTIKFGFLLFFDWISGTTMLVSNNGILFSDKADECRLSGDATYSGYYNSFR